MHRIAPAEPGGHAGPSVGANPVHRISKILGGLGPSLRWDDEFLTCRAILAQRMYARDLLNYCLTECHESLSRDSNGSARTVIFDVRRNSNSSTGAPLQPQIPCEAHQCLRFSGDFAPQSAVPRGGGPKPGPANCKVRYRLRVPRPLSRSRENRSPAPARNCVRMPSPMIDRTCV